MNFAKIQIQNFIRNQMMIKYNFINLTLFYLSFYVSKSFDEWFEPEWLSIISNHTIVSCISIMSSSSD